MRHRFPVALIFLSALLFSVPARADCAGPAGPEGQVMYNVTYKTMQFCDGTNWIAMGGGVSTIGADTILESMLKSVNAATDEYCLTYESTTGDFEWQTCGAGGDNLGDHTATQNINLGANYISRAGTAAGLSLDASNNATFSGDLRITGDDLIMTTNTAGMLLIADGTNFNPMAVSGDITITGAGVTSIGANKVTEAMLKAVNAPTDEYCLTYETTTGDFEWQTCGAGGLPTCSEGEGLIYQSGAWACTTADSSPDTFDFTDVPGAAFSTLTTSNIVLISGISGSVAVSVAGDGSPEWRSCSTGTCGTVIQTWTSGGGTIDNGKYIQLRLTTAATGQTPRVATVTVGTGGADWSAATGGKYVFITSTDYRGGSLGGVSGADAKCATRASAAGLSGTYKAWIGASGLDPASAFTHSSTGYILVDGTKVADNWNDLTDGTIDHGIDHDEFGNDNSGSAAWTAVDVSGAFDSGEGYCSNWADTTKTSMIGGSSNTNNEWTDTTNTGYTCNNYLSLYCFEQ